MGHDFGFNTVNPFQSEIAAIHKNPSQATKIELMRFIGSMNFLYKFMQTLHVIMKPLHALFHDNVLFWNIEVEILFQNFDASNKKDVTLT